MKIARSLLPGFWTVLSLAPALPASASGRCGEIDVGAIEHQLNQTVGVSHQTLFVTERNDLSRSLIELQYLQKTAGLRRGDPSLPLPVTQVLVFELSRQGHRLDNDNLVELAIDLDDAPLWRVGYDCKTKTVFHLYGFDDSTEGFNALIRALSLRAISRDLFLEIQSTFVALTYRGGLEDMIQSRLGLMRAVLDHFRGRDREDAFLEYWSKCPINVRRRIASPSAVPSDGGFTVSFFATNEEGVQSVSVFIESDGQIRSHDRRTIYRWPARYAKTGK